SLLLSTWISIYPCHAPRAFTMGTCTLLTANMGLLRETGELIGSQVGRHPLHFRKRTRQARAALPVRRIERVKTRLPGPRWRRLQGKGEVADGFQLRLQPAPVAVQPRQDFLHDDGVQRRFDTGLARRGQHGCETQTFPKDPVTELEAELAQNPVQIAQAAADFLLLRM